MRMVCGSIRTRVIQDIKDDFVQTMEYCQAGRPGILPEQESRAADHAEYFPRVCADAVGRI